MKQTRAPRVQEPGVYTLRDACHFTGAKPTQIEHWIRVGVFSPERSEVGGRGHHRVFTFRDLLTIAVCLKLNAVGFSKADLTAAVSVLRDVTTHRNDPSFVARLKKFGMAAETIDVIEDNGLWLHEQWLQFADPATRPEDVDYYVAGDTHVFGPYMQTGWTVATRAKVMEHLLPNTSDLHLVSLRFLLEQLESHTGASWPRSDAHV